MSNRSIPPGATKFASRHVSWLFSWFILAACSASSPPNGGGGTGGYGMGGGGAGGAGGAGNAGASLGGSTGGSLIEVPSGGTGSVPPATGGAQNTGGVPIIPPPVDQPVVVNECPGPLAPDVAQRLAAASGSPNGRLLYPYDGTVLPIGLPTPTFQWEQSGAADAVYVRMKSEKFEYQGCFAANADRRIPAPDSAWIPAQQQSRGTADPLTVEIVTQSGGNVGGPLKVQLYFAPGKLKGDLFYNTYTSPQANNNGAVMKLKLGAAAPQVLLSSLGLSPFGPCWSCHSLGANGGMLVAQHHQYPGGPYSSGSFDLIANPGLNPPVLRSQPSANGEMGLGAVYPDGKKVLTMGTPSDTSLAFAFPDGPGNVPAMIGPKASMLLDTTTGAQIPINGWTVQYAKMPSFSPDGSMVVFNWHEDSGGHSLAVAKFDNATNTMSDVQVIYKHDTLFPGWPFITPDNQDVVFVLGNKPDFVSAYPGRFDIAVSELWTVDIASRQARPLSRANGYPSKGAATYLPRPGRDEHLEFFPTGSPIAAGGYFWVFFTSRRTYGNIVVNGAEDAATKKIWVSAYNIKTDAIIEDPSNPPFYLPGQELQAGNIRAFAALEPCRQEGDTCETGVDCCKGHCHAGKCGPPPPPPPPPPGEPPPPPCSRVDEACTTAADCCDPKARCLRSFCTIPAPPR